MSELISMTDEQLEQTIIEAFKALPVDRQKALLDELEEILRTAAPF